MRAARLLAVSAAALLACGLVVGCADVISADFSGAKLREDGGEDTGPTFGDAGRDGAVDPSTVAPLALWVAADRGLELADAGPDAARVGVWRDLSDAGHDLTSRTSLRAPDVAPVGPRGSPAVVFTAARRSYLECPKWLGPGGTVLSAFWVTRGNAHALLRFHSGLDQNRLYAPWDTSVWFGGARHVQVVVSGELWPQMPLPELGAWDMAGFTYQAQQSAGLRTYRMGALLDQMDTAAAMLPKAPFFMGGIEADSRTELFSDAAVLEVLLYAASLDDAQRRSVETYLRRKWDF
jgi:hypothetical protein